MLTNNHFKPINIAQQMSLYDFWLTTLKPTLPILADEAQLSIGQLRQVLPDFVKVILLKLSTKITPYTAYNQQGLSDLAENPLVSNLRLLLPVANTLKAQGLNFLTASRLSIQRQSILEQFFDDDTQTLILAGVLLERTQLPLDKLLIIWQILTTLTLASLADIIEAIHQKMTTAQMNAWLGMQPVFFVVPNDMGLMHTLNYQPTSSIREMQKQRQKWLTISNLAELSPDQQLIVQQMQRFQTVSFFSIAPVAIRHGEKQVNSVARQVKDYEKPKASNVAYSSNVVLNTDIFAKRHTVQPVRWLDALQKNWVATTTVLSIAVFGGMGALIGINDKVSTQPTTPLSLKKPIYQDVAIVKIASMPSTDSTLTTAKDTKKAKASKRTEKTTSASSIADTDSKKPSKQPPQKTDERKSSSDDTQEKSSRKQTSHKVSSKDKKKTANKKSNERNTSDKNTTKKENQTSDKAVKQKDKMTSSKTAKDKTADNKYVKSQTHK